MKTLLARCAAAAALSFGFTGAVQAVPIYFDFTGTIQGTDTAISGGFNFETDRLLSAGDPPGGWQYSFVDWQPVGLTSPLAFLSFGGRDVSFPQYEDNYSLISFADHCTSTPCAPNAGDSFTLQAHTSDRWTPDYTGTRRYDLLLVLSYDLSSMDFIDGVTGAPTDIVSMPLHSLIGIYSEEIQECIAGSCTQVSNSQIGFSLDTVSRGLGARSVPEPGTLGLLGVALGGVLLRRRRPPVKPG